MKRRDLLKIGVGLTAISADPLLSVSSAEPEKKNNPNNAIYIPGYWPGDANFEGVAALDHPKMARAIPKKYTGSIRLLTKLGLDGEVVQALFPVHGHDVEISADGKIGFFGSLEQDTYVCFDPKSLDLIALGKPWKEEWIGGGHGIFVNQGKLLAVSERAPKVGYRGQPSKHFGRITLRDPETLKIVDSFSTHGISPHDIRLLKDGKHLAIANYGSTFPKFKKEYGVPRHIVEPSVTLINIQTGELVNKYVSGSREMEMRHLCAHDFDTIFAIQTELGIRGQDAAYHGQEKTAYEAEFTVPRTLSYLHAPTVMLNKKTGSLAALGSDSTQKLMRHGLSIHYDPEFDEVIATYPATHMILVFDARSGEVKQQIDCTKIGLNYPCGLTLIPGSNTYAVAGYWKDLYLFERGTHHLKRELCHYTTFFGHSHITAV